MDAAPKHAKKAFISAVVGTVLVALCCFTPVLVLVLSLLGVSFLTPYLDYVLLPALVVLLIVTVLV
jgi:mercuric ion transport protein